MEISWDEVLETAQLFSKLPKPERIREHVRWARDNGILSLDKLTSKDMFRLKISLNSKIFSPF